MCDGCNTPESIIMTRRLPLTETRIVLRTILSAGTAAGATWVVDDDGGADHMGMRTVEAAA